jgi:hypothetical protein
MLREMKSARLKIASTFAVWVQGWLVASHKCSGLTCDKLSGVLFFGEFFVFSIEKVIL